MPPQSPIIIKFFSSFCESKECKRMIELVCETHLMENYGVGKEINVTTDDELYTHAIIINTAMPDIRADVPKSNVIGIAYEPPIFLGLTPEFVEYARKNLSKYYIGEKYDLPDPFEEKYTYLWFNTPLPTNITPPKNKIMSIMISKKNFAPGHKYRHIIVQHIINNRLPIDIYGRGCECYDNMEDCPNMKGEFIEHEPYQDYEFHIAIENYQTNRYFSEKIINTLICGTTPIYFGCNNINEYFPNNVIRLSGVIIQDMRLLIDILNDPYKYRRRIDIADVKQRCNMLKNLDKLFG
jgi:hypothetical protein